MPPASSFRLLVSQSGTGAFWYRTGPLIPVPDSPAFQYFKKEIHTVCMYTPQEKDWDTACTFTLLVVHTAGRGKTPCKSILLAVEGDTPCMSLLLVVKRGGIQVHSAGCGRGHTLGVHTAGCARGNTLHVHTAGVERGVQSAHPYCWL
jgi:hypothetical protein